MQTKSSFTSYIILVILMLSSLIGCDVYLPPADDPGNSGGAAIEEQANLEENDTYEVEVDSLENDSSSQTEDSDGEYEVEVDIINDGEEQEATEEEESQARSLDDASSEDGTILREGKHTIYVGDQHILDAFADQRSDMLVEGSAIVDRTLSDDNEGSRHQRFILSLENGHTVLVAHNIDISPKIPLKAGDWIDYRGEYEWTEQGGVIHWTHHDPQGRHLDGWIFHDGEFYD